MTIPTFSVINPAQMDDNAPLSKRRRFVPNSLPQYAATIDPSEIENYTSDSPLLLQFSGQMPTPEEIEAQLLQVGMRIRKSVNDGYKNHKFTPRPFFNMHRLSPQTQAALCGSNTEATTTSSPYSAGGLHNVGGLAMQPISTATFCGINLAALAHITTPAVEEQKMWSYSTSHKRGYEGDSDSDDQEFFPQTPTLAADTSIAFPVDYFAIDFENMSDISPFTQVGETLQTQLNGRKMAKPRSRRSAPATTEPINMWNPFAQMDMHPPQSHTQHTGTQWMGHKRMTSCGLEANMMMNVNDFGEATFLQRREDVEMDCS